MALALAAVADGHSLITENVFEARFRFVDELIRMGADARTDGHHASLRGREQLSSAPVWSTDIRAGAGLVLAGLAAEGVTEVHEVMHIDRGYPHFVEDLQKLGGKIERVGDETARARMPACTAATRSTGSMASARPSRVDRVRLVVARCSVDYVGRLTAHLRARHQGADGQGRQLRAGALRRRLLQAAELDVAAVLAGRGARHGGRWRTRPASSW